MESIILGGGCFWCIEAIYNRVDGVISVKSGYAGGQTDNPTYEEICSGQTGHAEVVKIEFDINKINFDEILDIFWQVHDPTTLNRQGNDVGTQYRSVIYFTDNNHLEIIENSIIKLKNSNMYKDEIITEIQPLNKFYPAENYHQNYYNNNSNQPYCKLVINPKILKFEAKKNK